MLENTNLIISKSEIFNIFLKKTTTFILWNLLQQIFTSSKSTTEALGKGMKYVQRLCSVVFNVNFEHALHHFEQVNVY